MYKNKEVIVKNVGQIILKKMEDFDKNLKEDLEFVRRTEEAWKQYDQREFVSMDAKDFLKKLKRR